MSREAGWGERVGRFWVLVCYLRKHTPENTQRPGDETQQFNKLLRKRILNQGFIPSTES
jgi:hypothetical protein